LTDLGTLGGKHSAALGINNLGQVVGGSTLTIFSSVSHAFVWKDGAMTDLGALPGNVSQARDISDTGIVVGYSDDGTSNDGRAIRAVRWDASGIQPIGGPASFANAVNDSGIVVGGGGTRQALVWDGTSVTSVGLGNTPAEANDINSYGNIVGRSAIPGPGSAFTEYRAFLSDESSTLNLGTLTTGGHSVAFGINNHGVIVGATGVNSRAFIWSEGVMTDLNSLIDPSAGWLLQEANAVNDRGEIIGFGTLEGVGVGRGFLLVPVNAVPEPRVWVLFSLGFVVLVLFRTSQQRMRW
jgi:probable HAF family extracellular repeat protein